MELNNNYWKGIEEVEKQPEFIETQGREFSDGLPLDEIFETTNLDLNSNRRDFLKFFGFSVSAVALAACNTAPIKNAIPYVVKPQNVTPGNPNYYASTCGACASGCGMLVKTREGRPIKLDGNELSPINGSAICATGQASILSLYDLARYTSPFKGKADNASKISWSNIDKEISSKLSSSNGAIKIVSNHINSPSMLKAIELFKTKYAGAEHIVYEAVSYSGILDANEKSIGKRIIPTYHFDKADVIVSFGADFLGTWLSPVEFTKKYRTSRVPKNGKMSKHIQFESILSLTGTNADVRIPMKTSKEAVYLSSLYNEVASLLNSSKLPLLQNAELAGNAIKNTAKELVDSKGKSLVISGSNIPEVQILVNGLNILLGNYGQTIDIDNHSKISSYNESQFDKFVNDLNSGTVKAVIFINCNPAYSYANADKLKSGISKVDLSISISNAPDETSTLCNYIAPDHHYLESWGDSEPKPGLFSFTQPVISPVFETRQALESILTWSGNNQNAYDFIQNYWVSGSLANTLTWNKAIHDGIVGNIVTGTSVPSFSGNLTEIVTKLNSEKTKSGDFELVLYQKVGVKDGSQANNPWCHELPDPVTKTTWDNYVTISKLDSEKSKIKQNDVVTITANGKTLENVPVLIQPGQISGTIAVAIGYGRTISGKVGNDLGINAYPLSSNSNTNTNYNITGDITITKTGKTYHIAQTQTHHTIEGRDFVREATLNEYNKNPYVRNENRINYVSLWQEYDYSKGHKWGMAIDLNACTGCGACIVSCHIENNVPVVGRDQVRLRREMHWLRIDRYYSFETKNASLTKEKEINKEGASAYDNVKVVHVPVMCQHCSHAPCETVCPVLATTHSTDGLNQMTYNRCIGTKYCGNNCPYKVRRFNWFRFNDNDKFDYHFNNDLGKMVINPDVTVRTRGVMEKCSMCVQRIQAGKLSAKRENRKIKDGDFTTACAAACPSNAIVFGDINNPESEIAKLFKNERSYFMLEEVGIKPSIAYQTKIRNTQA